VGFDLGAIFGVLQLQDQLSGPLVQAAAVTETATAQMGTSLVNVQAYAKAAQTAFNNFSGENVAKQAYAMADAVQRAGGVANLTAAEQTKLNATLTTFIEKAELVGATVPATYRELAAATAQAEVSTASLGASISNMAASLGLAFGAGMIVHFVESVVTGAAEIQHMSERIGVSTDAVQRFQYAADLTGASVDGIGRSITFMNKTLALDAGGTEKLLANIGLKFSDIRAMAPEDAFNAIAAAIALIPDPMLRSEAAVKLFGRTGAELLPAIMENLAKLGAQAPIVSAAIVQGLTEAERSWKSLWDHVIVATAGILGAIDQIVTHTPEGGGAQLAGKSLGERLAFSMGAPVPTPASTGAIDPKAAEMMRLFAAQTAVADGATVTFSAHIDALAAAVNAFLASAGQQLPSDMKDAELTMLRAGASAAEITKVFKAAGKPADEYQIAIAGVETAFKAATAAAKKHQDALDALAATHTQLDVVEEQVILAQNRQKLSAEEIARIDGLNVIVVREVIAGEVERVKALKATETQLGKSVALYETLMAKQRVEANESVKDLLSNNQIRYADDIATQDLIDKRSMDSFTYQKHLLDDWVIAQRAKVDESAGLSQQAYDAIDRLATQKMNDLTHAYLTMGALDTTQLQFVKDDAQASYDYIAAALDETTGKHLFTTEEIAKAWLRLHNTEVALSDDATAKIISNLGAVWSSMLTLADTGGGNFSTLLKPLTTIIDAVSNMRAAVDKLTESFVKMGMSAGDAATASKLVAGGSMVAGGAASTVAAIQTGNTAGTIAGAASTGAGIGTMVEPGVGTAIGAGIGALVGVIIAWRNEVQANQTRDKFVATFAAPNDRAYSGYTGGMGEMGAQLQDIGRTDLFSSLVKADSADKVTAATTAISNALKQVAADVQKYSLAWADLTPDRQITATATSAQNLVATFNELSAAGYAPAAVIAKIGTDLNTVLRQALQTGQQLPTTMQPLLEMLAKSGGLATDVAQKLLGITAPSPAPWQAMETAAAKYGIAVSSLGAAFSQSKLDDTAKGLQADWHTLIDNGASIIDVTKGMSASTNTYIQDALKAGDTIPAAMKPMLQSMIDQGTLLAANGDKITDISKLSFAGDLTTSLDKLVAALNQMFGLTQDSTRGFGTDLPKAIKDANGAIATIGDTATLAAKTMHDALAIQSASAAKAIKDNLGNLSFDIPVKFTGDAGGYYVPGGLPGGSQPGPPSFAAGSGGFRDFGSGTLAMLHGREAVVPEGQGLGGGQPILVQVHLNGRVLAEAVVPEIPRVITRYFGGMAGMP
jgi:hypothetical protein